MNKSSQKKSEQLGMNVSTAHGRLKKMLIFKMAKQLNMLSCFRCNEEIANEDDLSIEHKEDWLDSDNPVDKFFDIDNITFSHKSCNYSHGRRPHKICFSEEEKRHRIHIHQRAYRKRDPERYKRQRRKKYKRTGT